MYEYQGKLLCADCGVDFELIEIADKAETRIVCRGCWEEHYDNDDDDEE